MVLVDKKLALLLKLIVYTLCWNSALVRPTFSLLTFENNRHNGVLILKIFGGREASNK